jgi:hypothetical protein
MIVGIWPPKRSVALPNEAAVKTLSRGERFATPLELVQQREGEQQQL